MRTLMLHWLSVGLALALGFAACEDTPSAPVDDAQTADGRHTVGERPVAPRVRLSPELPTAADTLTAVVLDPEPGVEFTYRWFVDGLLEDSTGPTLPAGRAVRGQTVLVEVTATTVGGTSPWGGAAVTLGNAPPRCIEPMISPKAPTTNTPLTCGCSSLDDADGDPIAIACRWSGLAGLSEQCTVPPPHALPTGSELRCELTISDGESIQTTSATALLVNAAPTGGTAVLQPDTIVEGATVTCEGSGATDPDGVTWSYELLVDGTSIATGPSASVTGNSFDKGQTIDCKATPSDGELAGAPVYAPSVVVADSPASVVAAQASPAVVTRLDIPTCAVSLADPDPADRPAATTSWWRGEEVLTWNGSEPLGEAVVPGDTIHCQAHPAEAPQAVPVVSNAIDVTNLPPQIISVVISPPVPTVESLLECVVDATDPEGDDWSASITWTVDDATLATGSPTLAGVSAGSVVSCSATVEDAYEGTTVSASAPVTVVSSAPVVSGVAVTPAIPSPCSPVGCSTQSTTDPDGDPVLVTTELLANGEPAEPGLFPPGTELQCVVTATDPTNLSTTVASSVATVVNATPTVAGAVISPGTPSAGDTLTCAALEALDPDCGQLNTSVVWTIGDATVSGASLATVPEQAGQTATCSLQVEDGYAPSPAVIAEVVLGEPPSLPMVAVEVDTETGAVTCVAAEPLEAPAWFWRVGSGAEFQGPSFLPPALGSDCDLVRCRAESGGLSTNTAETVLPVGPDCDDGSPCTTESCSPAGGCVHTVLDGPCDDGDACTDNDSCDDGVCTGVLSTCDDGNMCTEGVCIDGFGCSFGFADGPCSDGSVCTQDDICTEGACVSGPTLVCDDDNPCTDDQCDAALGCVGVPNDGACDDGTNCTTDDTCVAGGCVGTPVGEPVDCPDSTSPVGFCLGGQCQTNQPPAVPLVTIAPEVPQAGLDLLCSAVSLDPDTWPEAVSYTYVWTAEPSGTVLGTGNTLPGTEITKGSAIACRVTASDGFADSPEGIAVASVGNAGPVLSGVAVQVANGVAACVATVVDPDPTDVVTTEITWYAGDTPLSVDGTEVPVAWLPGCATLSCRVTASDGVATGTLLSSPANVTDPAGCGAEPCLEWSCSTGVCTSTLKTGGCSDGDPCTGPGTCQQADCVAAALPESACDDDNPCTADTCAPGVGCLHTPIAGSCDADGSVCTQGDACNPLGECIPGPILNCDDGIACTVNACDPNTGCTGLFAPEDVEFAIDFGTVSEFVALEDEAETELVQGPQGAEHIEFSLKYVLPSSFSWQPLRSRVTVTLEGPCCGGTDVGGQIFPNMLSDLEGPNNFVSGTVIGIFDGATTVGQTVCARVDVLLYDQTGITVVASSSAHHMFTLIDEQ